MCVWVDFKTEALLSFSRLLVKEFSSLFMIKRIYSSMRNFSIYNDPHALNTHFN